MSSAVIGDQLYAVLRMRSSFLQMRSPLATARASSCGLTVKRSATIDGGNGSDGRDRPRRRNGAPMDGGGAVPAIAG